uniref:Anion exchange protein n=1 Tax=Macrostomum lignano TaxID=282301 RepID=A0A1I8JR02_9PLAT
PQSQTADPSARVQFLLGSNQDDDENGPDEPEWKETARWIKFEEDVEEGGERWSKPHVATLSLFALFEVRNSIYNGEIMLECEGQTMESIADLLLDRLVQKRKLTSESRELVKDVLLKRHLHLHEKKARGNLGAKIRSFAEIGRKHSSKDLDRGELRIRANRTPFTISRQSEACRHSSRGDIEAQQHGAEGPELTASASSYRKIPPGAETSNILVGSTDFLDHPVTAFIRLKTAVVLLGDLTEVPVPTRFIYVLLGPPDRAMGRSMATLMSDEVFHDVAYLAKSKLYHLNHICLEQDDLLCGVDEFLKSCTVLPPNEWDPSIRIEPPKEVPSQEPRKQGSVPVTGSNALLGTSASVPAALASHELASGSNGGEGGGSATASSGANLLSKSGPNGDSPPPAYEETCHTDPSLRITGRLFGGLVEDVKRKAPFYWSDIRDAIHGQHLRIPSYNDSMAGITLTTHPTAIVLLRLVGLWDKNNNKLCTAQQGQLGWQRVWQVSLYRTYSSCSCLLAIGTFVISYGLKLMRTFRHSFLPSSENTASPGFLIPAHRPVRLPDPGASSTSPMAGAVRSVPVFMGISSLRGRAVRAAAWGSSSMPQKVPGAGTTGSSGASLIRPLLKKKKSIEVTFNVSRRDGREGRHEVLALKLLHPVQRSTPIRSPQLASQADVRIPSSRGAGPAQPPACDASELFTPTGLRSDSEVASPSVGRRDCLAAAFVPSDRFCQQLLCTDEFSGAAGLRRLRGQATGKAELGDSGMRGVAARGLSTARLGNGRFKPTSVHVFA